MNLGIDHLEFTPANKDDCPNLGVYLRAGTDGDLLSSTTLGAKEALDVNIAGLDAGVLGIFAEDSIHTTADLGQFVLAVQTAAQGALAGDGDYAPFQVDGSGRLRVIADIDLTGDLVGDDEVDSEDPLKVGSHAYDQASVWGALSAAGDKANLASDLYRRILINDAPNVLLSNAQQDVDNAAEVLLVAAGAGRTRYMLQNLGVNEIYVGATGVTTGTGIQVKKGSTMSLELGEALDLYAISDSATASDVRIMQIG